MNRKEEREPAEGEDANGEEEQLPRYEVLCVEL